MGVDYSGGMIVGRAADEISYDQDEFEYSWEYAEEYTDLAELEYYVEEYVPEEHDGELY